MTWVTRQRALADDQRAESLRTARSGRLAVRRLCGHAASLVRDAAPAARAAKRRSAVLVVGCHARPVTRHALSFLLAHRRFATRAVRFVADGRLRLARCAVARRVGRGLVGATTARLRRSGLHGARLGRGLGRLCQRRSTRHKKRAGQHKKQSRGDPRSVCHASYLISLSSTRRAAPCCPART